MEKIKEIEKKIKNLKNKKIQATSYNSNINGKFYSMAVNISLELITGIGLGVILGLMVDNYLQTKPIMLIIFFIVGTVVGFYNMYKSLKRYGYFN